MRSDDRSIIYPKRLLFSLFLKQNDKNSHSPGIPRGKFLFPGIPRSPGNLKSGENPSPSLNFGTFFNIMILNANIRNAPIFKFLAPPKIPHFEFSPNFYRLKVWIFTRFSTLSSWILTDSEKMNLHALSQIELLHFRTLGFLNKISSNLTVCTVKINVWMKYKTRNTKKLVQ